MWFDRGKKLHKNSFTFFALCNFSAPIEELAQQKNQIKNFFLIIINRFRGLPQSNLDKMCVYIKYPNFCVKPRLVDKEFVFFFVGLVLVFM